MMIADLLLTKKKRGTISDFSNVIQTNCTRQYKEKLLNTLIGLDILKIYDKKNLINNREVLIYDFDYEELYEFWIKTETGKKLRKVFKQMGISIGI